MSFADNCVAIAIKDAVSVGAPYGIHFYVEYRTVRRSNRLFNWGDGAIRAHRPLILEGGPDEVPLLATDLYE
jgi:hypothetical protein